MSDALFNLLEIVFGGDAGHPNLTPAQIAARAILLLFVGLVAVRIGKSRMLSRASPLDILLLVMLGSLLSRGINGSGSLSGTIAGTLALVLAHWLTTAAACRSHILGQWIKGHTYVLIRDGQILHENLARSHMS